MEFKELCELFLREKNLEGVKTSTLSNYTYVIDGVFIPYLPKSISELTEATLYSLVEKMMSDLSRKTVIDKVVLLNGILKFASKKNYLKQNFFLPVPSMIKNKTEIFMPDEQETIKEYLFKNLSFFEFGVLLTLYTGLRIGELSALQKKDINRNILKVRKTLQRIKNLSEDGAKKTIVVIDEPKTQCSLRDIPVLEDLVILFENMYSYLDDDVFILTGTKKYIEPRTIERKFEKLLKICQVEYKKFHILRHTFATNCVKAGFDIKTLSEILGHSNIRMTLERYVYCDFAMKVTNMKKLCTLKMS